MVSFELSEDQKLVREAMAAFAAGEIRSAARESDESGTIAEALVAKGWELGLVQSAIPESHGGFGDSREAVTGVIALEELGYGDLSIALHLLAPRLLAFPVLEYGTEEQKQRILGAFTGAAYTAGTSAVIEPFMGFDLSSLQTTHRRDGTGWIVSGKKAFVPVAPTSDWILVYSRDAAIAETSDPLAGYAAVEGFLVPQGAAGVEISAREKNMGLKALATHEVTLRDVRVDGPDRLGGDASIDFARLMNLSRVALSALAVGVARAAFEYARDYAKERKAFGVPIAQKQAIAFMLAEMAIEIDAARLLNWEAAWKLDCGEEATREAYLAKNYAANVALQVADNAVQVLGGHGYIRDHLVELWLRNARGFSSFEGLAIV